MLPFWKQLETFEIFLINSAMDKGHGNISEAARILQMGRTTLSEKMKKYGLRDKKKPPDKRFYPEFCKGDR